MCSHFEVRDTVPDFLDNPDAFMPEDSASRDTRHVAFEDVKVRSADGGRNDSDDRVRGCSYRRPRFRLQGSLTGPEVNQSLHRRSRTRLSQNEAC